MVDDAVVLRLSGKLVSDEAYLLDRHVQRVLSQGSQRVVLDVADVTYVDSTGLGALILAHTTLQRAGGGLRLERVNARLHEPRSVTRLLSELDVGPGAQGSDPGPSLSQSLARQAP